MTSTPTSGPTSRVRWRIELSSRPALGSLTPVARWRFTTHPVYIDPTTADDGHWEVDLNGPAPGELAWHEPIVALEEHTPNGRVPARGRDVFGWTTRGGCSGSTTCLDGGSPWGSRYVVRCWNPSRLGTGTYRFECSANADPGPVVSAPFA